MINPMTFGQLLRHLRKRAGMTQGDLAAATDYSTSYISALEKEQRRPDAAMVAKRFAPLFAQLGEVRLVDQLLELATNAPNRAPAPVHGALPPLPVKLLGRDAELAAICQRLLSHPGRLLTLTGPPGIGKTSLALAVAHALAPFHADGAFVVWLGAVESVELVAPALATALGIVANSQPSTARLVAHLRRRELLLVLDNFEQVMAAAPLVAELLAACPALRILVTSHARLRLRAEQSLPIRPLDSGAAVALFVARVRAQDPTFALTQSQQGDVATICRLLDHLPLAIELIAAHALRWPLEALIERLSDRRLDLLDQRGVGLPADQPTLTTALQRSYELLTAEEQRLLRMLGIFAGGVRLDALEWLGFDLRTVQALANKSLVRLESVGDTRRVLLLETVRDYALHRLQEAGETAAAQRGRLAWAVALAERAEPLLHGAAQTHWLERLEPDRCNFYAALQFALEAGAVADAVRICVALRHFWVARNHGVEIEGWLGAIHAAGEGVGLDALLWVRLLNCDGTMKGALPSP